MNEMLKRSIIPIARQIECCVGAIDNVVENVPDEGAFRLVNPSDVVEQNAWQIIKCATKMLAQLFKDSPKFRDEDIDSKRIVSEYVLNRIGEIMLRLFAIEEIMNEWIAKGAHDCLRKATEKALNELSLMTDALMESVCINVLKRKI